jgi:hypothetical protein
MLIFPQISISGGAGDRVKEMIQNEPMASALEVTSLLLKNATLMNNPQLSDLAQSSGRLALHIIDIGNKV